MLHAAAGFEGVAQDEVALGGDHLLDDAKARAADAHAAGHAITGPLPVEALDQLAVDRDVGALGRDIEVPVNHGRARGRGRIRAHRVRLRRCGRRLILQGRYPLLERLEPGSQGRDLARVTGAIATTASHEPEQKNEAQRTNALPSPLPTHAGGSIHSPGRVADGRRLRQVAPVHGRQPLRFTRAHPALATFLLALSVLTASPATADGNTVLERPPAQPDPGAHYLFYLHGRILEGQGNRRPKHPQYGVYEYDELLQALSRRGRVVISEIRPKDARVETHAQRVAKQIEALRKAGVHDDHITVVGFSKGGWIAQRVSALLDAPITYVLLASCPPGTAQAAPTLHGRILSVRERSDDVPSCKPLFARAAADAKTEEVLIDLGGGHGAFYRPNPVWLQAVLKFAH